MYLRIKKTVSYFLWRRKITGMEIYSSHAAFYAMVSLVPLLMLSLMILKGLAPFGIEEAFLAIKAYLPLQLAEYFPADLAKNAMSANFSLVSLTVLAMLWTSSRGINALSDGIRAVYGVGERRGFVSRRISELALTFLLLFLFVLALFLLVLGKTLLRLAQGWEGEGVKLLFLAVKLAPLCTFVLFWAVFSVMYKVILADGSGLKSHVVGAAFAAGGWLVYSWGLSFYLTNFMPSKYILYGSLGALILFMLWVRALMTILLLGAELNVRLQNRTVFCH